MPEPAYKTKLTLGLQLYLENILSLIDFMELNTASMLVLDASLYKQYEEADYPDWSDSYFSKVDMTSLLEGLFKSELLDSFTSFDLLKDDIGVNKIGQELLGKLQGNIPEHKEIGLDINKALGFNEFLKFFPLHLLYLCPALFGERSDQVLNKARNGDRESILKLIQLDKSLISAEWSAKELRKAQLTGDFEYFREVSKVMAKDPFKPSKKNSKMVCFLVMGWPMGLNKLTNVEVFEYIKDIGLYGSEDPDSLYREIKRLKLRKNMEEV